MKGFYSNGEVADFQAETLIKAATSQIHLGMSGIQNTIFNELMSANDMMIIALAKRAGVGIRGKFNAENIAIKLVDRWASNVLAMQRLERFVVLAYIEDDIIDDYDIIETTLAEVQVPDGAVIFGAYDTEADAEQALSLGKYRHSVS